MMSYVVETKVETKPVIHSFSKTSACWI